jgi:hypothetical protein
MLQVINRDLYELYKQKRKKVAKEIDQYKLFEKVVSGIFSCLMQMIKDSENGVYIKGLGYFFHNKSDKKVKGKREPFIKRIKKRYVYHADFYPDDSLEGWYITYTNNTNYNKKEYSVYFDVVKSMMELDTINNVIKRSPRNIKHLL